MLGMFTIIAILSMLPKVIRALTVGHEIISVIDREPKIISPKDKSLIVSKIMIDDGIKFRNVTFRYPTAPETVKEVF